MEQLSISEIHCAWAIAYECLNFLVVVRGKQGGLANSISVNILQMLTQYTESLTLKAFALLTISHSFVNHKFFAVSTR